MLDNDYTAEYRINIYSDFDTIYKLAFTLVDLQTIVNRFHLIIEGKNNEKSWHTSRRYNSPFKNNLKLKKLTTGSLECIIVANVISGIILMFLGKFFKDNPKIVININEPIYIDSRDKIHKDILEDIFSKTKIIPDDAEQSLENLYDTLRKMGYIKHQIAYDINGKIPIAKDIIRLGGMLYDSEA